MSQSSYIESTQKWIEKIVIDLNLCPFALRPFCDNKILYRVNLEVATMPLINEVVEAVNNLENQPSIETSFIIFPKLEMTFETFFEFVSELQDMTDRLNTLEVTFVAFHPEFKYQDTQSNETSNATNRSPYPMLHILRKSSLDTAAKSDINLSQLLKDNQAKLSSMSWEQIQRLWKIEN